MYRSREFGIEIFLVHPGGPSGPKKTSGAWSVPKGEYAAGEDPLHAARREFSEEAGFAPDGEIHPLGTIRQAGGKLVSVWAIEGDCDPAQITSNLCKIEWPPRSGRKIEIPEVDRASWFSVDEARERILKSQAPVLDLLGCPPRPEGALAHVHRARVSANASCQCGSATPNRACSFAFDMTEFFGRFAGVGYSVVRIPVTSGHFLPSGGGARRKISCAKPHQLVAPMQVM